MTVYNVTGVDDTGGVDVTASLEAFIATCADGTDGSPNTIMFGLNKTYKVEGTLTHLSRNHLIFDWNGSTLICDTAGTLSRSHVRVTRCTDIRITGLTIRGPNAAAGLSDAAYVAALEVQHAFDVLSSTDITIDNCTVSKIYGDWLYLGLTGAYGWADGVLVEDCVFSSNGRQGFGLVACRNVEVRNCTTGQCRRSLIDLEPNGQTGGCDEVWFHHNTFGQHRLSFIASKGYPAHVDNITIEDNTIANSTSIICEPPSPGTRSNWVIRNNIATGNYSSGGSAAWYFVWVDGLTVTGNTQVVLGSGKYLCRLADCTDFTISGNNAGASSQFYEANSTPAGEDPPFDPDAPARETPVVVGAATSIGFATSISATLPVGSLAGDVAVAYVGHIGTWFTSLLDDDWTIIDTQASEPGYPNAGKQAVMVRRLTDTDISNGSLTFQFAEGGSSTDRSLASVAVLRGVVDGPPDSVTTARSGSYKAFVTVPGLTTTAASALVVFVAAAETGNAVVEPTDDDLDRLTGGANGSSAGWGTYIGSVVYDGTGLGKTRTFPLGGLASVYGVGLAFLGAVVPDPRPRFLLTVTCSG